MTEKSALPAVSPWEKIAWSQEREQIIYRDWGVYYTRKQQLDIAAKYYDNSLRLKKDDSAALYYRSICKRDIAQTEGALTDAVAAAVIDKTSAPIRQGICDALYELNQFENCKVELHDNTRRFIGKKVAAFMERIIVVDENFNDSIGESLGPFIYKNSKHFPAVLEELRSRSTIDTRPLWKILKEQGKCDVLSILDKEELLLSPREIARRERAYRVFNQIYFNNSWIDVLFLRNLRNNPSLLLPQTKITTPYLQSLTANKYIIIRKFLKMLQARSPLYNEQALKCPDKKMWTRHREAHLYRVQYQTRRNMLTILRSIKEIRKSGKIQKLSRYIEGVMGDYVVLKTYRVMPWKFEFMNEVYNTLAMAHVDRFTNLPPSFTSVSNKLFENKMLLLLRLPTDKYKDITHFVFGDRSTYQEPDAVDYAWLAYKRFLTRLEKRMHFAKFGIERCYLLHEIARSHLSQSRFNECCSASRKAVEEAKRSSCPLWQFLSTMLTVKSHAVLHKVERCREALDEATEIVGKLRNTALVQFVELCKVVNDEEFTMKKHNRSDVFRKHQRSKTSTNSQSHQSQLSQPSEQDDDLPELKPLKPLKLEAKAEKDDDSIKKPKDISVAKKSKKEKKGKK